MSSINIVIVVAYLVAMKYMKDTVQEFVRKRRETKEKEEKLFIDSLLECDFVDEETVSKLSWFLFLGLFITSESNQLLFCHHKFTVQYM